MQKRGDEKYNSSTNTACIRKHTLNSLDTSFTALYLQHMYRLPLLLFFSFFFFKIKFRFIIGYIQQQGSLQLIHSAHISISNERSPNCLVEILIYQVTSS